jgi:hypothetical protein
VSIEINDDIEKIKALEDNILEQYNKNVELANKMEQETEKFAKQANTAIEDYNSNAETKTEEFNTNVKEKTDEFNSNATEKETEISDIADGFDANVEEKTNTFNSNVETKTTEFNNNSNAKTEEFNNNSTEKINAFNSNAEEKIAEYDAHTEKLTNRIADLEEENSELVEQMPWNITEVQGSIHVDDAAKYSKNKLNVFGNLIQDETVTIPIDIEKSTKNNYISQSGALASSSITDTTDYIEVKPNKTYTVNLAANDTNFRNLVLFDSNKAVIEGKSYKGNSFSFTTTESACYVRFSYINTAKLTMSTEFDFNYPSMPVVATGLQKIKKIGKNFIPYPYAENSKSTYGIQYTVNKDGSIAVSGTSKNPACDFYLYGSSTDTGEYLYMKKGTYSIADTNIYNILYIAREKTLGALIGVAKIKQALASQDCYFYGYFLRVEKDITVNTTFYPKLELNDTETFYEQYNGEEITLDLGTTELCKITDSDGNVVAQDRPVYRETDEIWKWQWEKKVLKAVINSKTEIKYNGLKNNNTAVDFLSQTLKNLPANVFSPIIEKITRYNYLKPNSTTSVNNFRITVSLANLGIEKFTTPENAVKALKNLITKKGDAIIYYKATEPIYEDCTVDQSEALEKLYKMQLEKGVNNIFVESENGVTTELQLEYMQDNNLKKEQKNKALEDRITAIENLLSTTQTSALLLDNMQTDLEKEVE